MTAFQSWRSLAHVAVSAVSTYAALVLLLRVSGKRTLSQMNIFDFVVTVAIGTTLASTILSRDIVILDGLVALVILVFLQFIVARATSRWRWMERLVKSQPRILYAEGRYDTAAMRRERVAKEEVRQAMRSQGISSEADVAAVVLETNGKFSVLKKTKREGTSTFVGLS